jgi:hypothetical protein
MKLLFLDGGDKDSSRSDEAQDDDGGVGKNAVCEVGVPAGWRLGRPLDRPLYFEDRFFQDNPPAINRPEFYYGFVGVCLAWQVMFLVIAYDPVRYRGAMLPAMLEKAGFAVAIPLLYLAGRASAMWVGFASLDATWLVLFLVAYLQARRRSVAGEG